MRRLPPAWTSVAQRALQPQHLVSSDVRTDFSGSRAGVTKELSNETNVDASFVVVRGESMPKTRRVAEHEQSWVHLIGRLPIRFCLLAYRGLFNIFFFGLIVFFGVSNGGEEAEV